MENMIKCSHGGACNGFAHYDCEDLILGADTDEYVCSGCSSLAEYESQEHGQQDHISIYEEEEENGNNENDVSHECYCEDASKNCEETVTCHSSIACGGEVHLSCECVDDVQYLDLCSFVCSHCDAVEYEDSDEDEIDSDDDDDPGD